MEKTNISEDRVENLLQESMKRFEALFSQFTDEQFENHAQTIQSIINHEYLHQGQLVVMLRQAGVKLPERFSQAFDL